jgi:hypothetical protein
MDGSVDIASRVLKTEEAWPRRSRTGWRPASTPPWDAASSRCTAPRASQPACRRPRNGIRLASAFGPSQVSSAGSTVSESMIALPRPRRAIEIGGAKVVEQTGRGGSQADCFLHWRRDSVLMLAGVGTALAGGPYRDSERPHPGYLRERGRAEVLEGQLPQAVVLALPDDIPNTAVRGVGAVESRRRGTAERSASN